MRFSSSQPPLYGDSAQSDRMGIITAIALQSQAKPSHSVSSPAATSAHQASAPSCPQTRRFWDSPISQNLMADPQSRPGELESSLGTDLQPGLHLRLHIFIFLRFPQSSHRLGLAVLLGSLLLFAPLLNLLYSSNIFLLVVLGLFPCTARGDTAFTPPRDAGSCSTGTEPLLLWLSCSGSHQAGRGAMPAHRVTQMSPSAQPRLLPGPLAVLWVTSLEKGTSFTKMFSVSTYTGNLPKPCLASVSSSSPN